MKKVAFFLIIFLSLSVNAQDMQKLINTGDYIRLLNLGEENWGAPNDNFSVPFLRATIFNAMLRPEESNKELEFVLTVNEVKENPQLMIELLRIQTDNYIKMFQYKQAADTYKNTLDNYGNVLGERMVWYQSVLKMYDALSNVEPLLVNIPHNTTIQTKPLPGILEDLQQVQVHTPKDSVLLVFDTGAAWSATTRSVASSLGIRILADSILAGGATNNIDYMSIGVADTLYLGDIFYTNVVFGIFEDGKFTSPEPDIIVNGTLGLPEIKALSSIKIHKNFLEIFVNDSVPKNNMMLTGSQQVVVQANDSLLFWLDTGGAWTSLSVKYYNDNKEQVEVNGELSTKLMGGMGGSQEFPVYKLKNFPITINTITTTMPEIPVFMEPTTVMYGYDGTLGQDVISQYDYILLDFKNMYFALGNKKREE